MDARQDPKNTDDKVPVLAVVVKQFFDQFVRQAEDKNELPIELTNTTGTYLQQLNDDFLLQILSVKSLTLMDLCSLAETCTLFHRITQHVFPKDLGVTFSSNCHDVVARKYLPSTNRTIQDIGRIFKNFGSCLSEVSLRGRYCESSLFALNLVAEYCVESLDILRIEYMKKLAVLTVELKPIFERLQLLDLHYVVIEGADKTLFADLVSLIELRVRWVENDSAILENIFPKLERFIYLGNRFRFDHPLPTFISRHRNLKLLDINNDTENVFKVNFVPVIANSCKELEELNLNVGRTISSSLQTLQVLPSLKTLTLRLVEFEDFKFISSMTKLRELVLVNCVLPEELIQFALLTQLTKLGIFGQFRSFDVVELIRLTNLEKLTISGVYSRTDGLFVLNEKTFSKIVAIVKGRPNVLTLECKWNFVLNSKSCDDSRKVRLIRLID